MRPTHRQREQMVTDAIMRLTQGQAEYLQATHEGSRASITHATNDRAYLKGIGMITPPRKYPNREPRTTYTSVERNEGTSPNMAVTRDGITTIVPATNRGVGKKTRTGSPAMRHHTLSTTAADLPAIGNID